MIILYIGIGLFAGLSAGFFGIGGGVVVVPALTLLAGFSQEKAVGTSLAVLLPPVGLWAAVEYYKNGNVDIKAAVLIAIALIIGAWLGAVEAHKLGEVWLKAAFGVFLVFLGVWTVVEAFKGPTFKGF